MGVEGGRAIGEPRALDIDRRGKGTESIPYAVGFSDLVRRDGRQGIVWGSPPSMVDETPL